MYAVFFIVYSGFFLYFRCFLIYFIINISTETLYLIFDYPHKYYTFKHFEV